MLQLFIALALLMGATVAAPPAGVTASLDIGVIDQAKDVYFDFIMSVIKNTQIPDIDFSEGHLHGNKFSVVESAQNVNIVNRPDKNGIELSIDNMQSTFSSSDFKYKLAIITAKGSVEADFSKMSIKTVLSFTTQAAPDGRLLPAFNVEVEDLDLPKDHIKIHIHGNVVAKIADAFTKLFKGPIRKQIIKDVKKVIQDQLPPRINKLIADHNGKSEIFPGLDMDWSIPAAPCITDKLMQFAFKGLFFPQNGTEVDPSITPPAMPFSDASEPSKYQMFISNYLVNSLFDAFLKTYSFTFEAKSSDVPPGFPIQLNTTALNKFFPGMEAHYGPNLPVDVDFTLRKLENFKVRENKSTMGFEATLGVEFVVDMANNTRETAVNITLDKLLTNFTVLIEKQNQLVMNVTQAKLNLIQVESTTFGELNMTLVTKLFNLGFKVGIYFFNIWIKTKPVTIPTELFGLFELSDLVLKYHDDYLEAGLTPTFLPPSEIEGVYEKYVPQAKVPMGYKDTDVFEESVDESGNITSNVIRDYSWSEIFGNQVQIFRQIPFILTK